MASQSRQGRGRLLPISILGPCFCSPGSMNLAAEQEGHLLAASPHPQQVPDRPEDVQGLPGLPVATPVGGGDRHKLSSGLFGACHLFHAGTTPPQAHVSLSSSSNSPASTLTRVLRYYRAENLLPTLEGGAQIWPVYSCLLLPS